MSLYVDGMAVPVASENKQAFIAAGEALGPLFKEYGALSVVDCWGDDVPEGEHTSFPMAVKLGAGEVVCFSWISWPSKAVRDEAWAKLMDDPRMIEGRDMPYDGKRMIIGGFTTVVNV